MHALHTANPTSPLARPACTTPVTTAAAPASAAATAALDAVDAVDPVDPVDAQVVEDRLRALFRLSTRRGLIHPLHHVMLRFRKEALPPCTAQEQRA